jgi:hypothetical protein
MGKRLLLIFVEHLQWISLSMWKNHYQTVSRKNWHNESGVIFKPFVFGFDLVG